MKIIDVSKYQGDIDWPTTVKFVDFVILRASVGKYIDTKYNQNVLELERLNKPYHAYHYIKALTLDEARMEAKVFSESTKNSNPLFYVIDAEYNEIPRSSAKTIIEEFETELRRLVNNEIRVALYIGHDKYKKWLLNYNRYAYVWIPRYGKNTGNISDSTKPSYACDLWQYTSKGKVEGINHYVDLNTLNSNKPLSYYISGNNVDNDNPLLNQGDNSKEVKRMQSLLIALGYDLGNYGADGKFGKRTVAAVKQFQSDHGFQITGWVSEMLYDEMFALLINKEITKVG